jgi:hypothetical protein
MPYVSPSSWPIHPTVYLVARILLRLQGIEAGCALSHVVEVLKARSEQNLLRRQQLTDS